ncbi:hypothetical protein Jann_3103 [Jannaschia sp. CCS1]|nr:hypothetical protein Jann_3103 [Jannaschia sp. CCS1]
MCVADVHHPQLKVRTISHKCKAATAVVAILRLTGTQATATEAVDLITTFYETVDTASEPSKDVSAFFAEGFVDNYRPSIAPPGSLTGRSPSICMTR